MSDVTSWEELGCPDEDTYLSLKTNFADAQIGALCGALAVRADSETSISDGVNSGWLVLCGALVFIMHGGFAMVSFMKVHVTHEPHDHLQKTTNNSKQYLHAVQ